VRFFLPIFANLLLFTAALGYGSLLRTLIPERFQQIDRFALSLLAGLGLLGTLLFCVGQFSFSRGVFLLVLTPGIALAFRYLVWEKKQLGGAPLQVHWSLLPALVIVAVLLITAVAGLAEPAGDIRMDAIAYHLLGPKVWLRDSVIRPLPDESMTAFPAVVETQFGALMGLGAQRAPQFFSLIALVSILLITASLASRLGLSSTQAWWASALIITMPVLYRGAYGGFIDVIYSGFVLAALRIALDTERPASYLLVGMFCGFAMGTKYFGLFLWPILLIALYALAVFRKDRGSLALLRNLGIACICAAVIASPWYLRNWIQLGSPIYPPTPLLARFFHPKHLSSQAIQNFNLLYGTIRGGMGRSPLAFLLLPFHLTFHPANFMNGAGGMGLAPLALAPFGLFVRRADRFAQGLVLFILLQTIAWFASGQDPRFIIHVLVIAAIFAVLGWDYVARVTPTFGRILSGLVIVSSISYGLYMISSARIEDVRAVMSGSFAERRRHEEIPFVESFDYLNRDSTASKILVLDPLVPVYYLDKNYLRPVGRFGEQSLPEAANLPLLMSELPRMGISHVLDVRFPGKNFHLPDVPQNLTLVYQGEDQRIYRVR
jgi:hypothetical protein